MPNQTHTLTSRLTQKLSHSLTSMAGGSGGGGPSLVSAPAGLGWTPPVNVYRSAGGVYTTDYDPSPILIEGDPGVTTYYVDSATGSEANPGTAALPKAQLRNISASRTNKLLIKARGKFCYGITGPVFAYHDNLQVEAWGGAECLLTMETNASFPIVFTDETGGVWSFPQPTGSFSSIMSYLGTDPVTMVNYPVAANLAACQATPGTQFTQTGPTKHFIHTMDGSSPATGHTILGGNGNCCQVADRGHDMRAQYRGITFLGGDGAFSVAGGDAFNKRVDFIGCKFMHGRTTAALNCTGNTPIFLYQCITGPSKFDGNAVTAASGIANKMIEIECISRDNGYTSAANQGSTIHLGAKAMRVNGQYYNNANDQVADVNAGTVSWNVGCVFGPLKNAGYSGILSGNDGGDTKIWLDGCTFAGSPTFQVGVNAGAFMYYRNMPTPTLVSGTGTLAPY